MVNINFVNWHDVMVEIINNNINPCIAYLKAVGQLFAQIGADPQCDGRSKERGRLYNDGQ